MGTTYSSAGVPSPGRSLFIATPAYESVKPGYAYSLALTTAELVRHHVPFEIALMEGNCHVDDGRNTLVRDFLLSNCTDFLFIDADLMWKARDVLRMLAHTEPLVCGAYPKKCSPASYPIGRILHARPDGMMEVSYAPTGFMRIQREVFTKLLPTQSKHGKEKPTAVFFERRFNGNTRDGGDVTFCRKWIAAGGKVWVDPSLVLSHIGDTRWSGCFSDYLSKEENQLKHVNNAADPVGPGEGKAGYGLDDPRVYNSAALPEPSDIPDLIARIRGGASDNATFEDLATAYGNKPWAATWDFQKLMWMMATKLPKGSTILECGTGLSTILLAASGHRVLALEEHKEWADKVNAILDQCKLTAEVYVSPIEGDWYAFKQQLKGLKADFVVIDGPKRRDSVRRDWAITRAALEMGVAKPDAAVLWDDIMTVEYEFGNFIQCGTEARRFCAGRLAHLPVAA